MKAEGYSDCTRKLRNLIFFVFKSTVCYTISNTLLSATFILLSTITVHTWYLI
jgi:hypothetical protein